MLHGHLLLLNCTSGVVQARPARHAGIWSERTGRVPIFARAAASAAPALALEAARNQLMESDLTSVSLRGVPRAARLLPASFACILQVLRAVGYRLTNDINRTSTRYCRSASQREVGRGGAARRHRPVTCGGVQVPPSRSGQPDL